MRVFVLSTLFLDKTYMKNIKKLLKMNFDILEKAIDCLKIIPNKQKEVFKIICSRSYPISAKEIETDLCLSRPSINFSLKILLKRGFILRTKDNVFLYKANPERLEEIKERYIETIK